MREYTGHAVWLLEAGWFASVQRRGYADGYWRAARFTRVGAHIAAKRMAWWLNRRIA